MNELLLPVPVEEASERQSKMRKTIALPRFPATRYQGSKRKVLGPLKEQFEALPFESALDLFSGTGSVTLLLRLLGKRVTSNDYLLYNQVCARLFQSLDPTTLARSHEKNLRWLIHEAPIDSRAWVSELYKDIFFLPCENEQIDRFCQNIAEFDGPLKDLYVYAFGQALLKKRPYNLFHRANLLMRTKDVKRSFGNAVTWETDAATHALTALGELRKFPFDSPRNAPCVTGLNTSSIDELRHDYDLVYLDPPYVNSRGMGVDYSDFYGFLDGLCDYALFESGDTEYAHKPINKKPSAWLRADSALWELQRVIRHFPSSTLVISYRSDGAPTIEEIIAALESCGRSHSITSTGGYKYALSHAMDSDECVIVSRA